MPIKINKGFSLIELAIVLALSGLLLGTLVSGYITYRENSLYNNNVEKVKIIKEAILGFAVASRWDNIANISRLPCPDTNGDGFEDLVAPANTVCVSSFGNLPYSTLGLVDATTDPYGNPYFYRVDPQFADRDAAAPTLGTNTTNACTPTVPPPVPPLVATFVLQTNSSFQLCSLGDITILNGAVTNPANPNVNILAINVPFIILSQGQNSANAIVNLLALNRVDEIENSQNIAVSGTVTADVTLSRYVFRRISTNLPANNFDDVLIWATQYELNNKMLEAQILP